MPRAQYNPLTGTDEYAIVKELGRGAHSWVLLAEEKGSKDLVRTVRHMQRRHSGACANGTFSTIVRFSRLCRNYVWVASKAVASVQVALVRTWTALRPLLLTLAQP